MPDPIQGVTRVDPLGLVSTGQTGSSPAPPAPPADAPASVDTADLTRTESLLSTISTATAGVPTTDRARIAQLQQAINSGTYTVNPQQIADKLVEIEGQLPASGKGC
jgi:negative regulator of flagellin synthesis FlgM